MYNFTFPVGIPAYFRGLFMPMQIQSCHPEFRNSSVVAFIVQDKYRALRHITISVGFLILLYYSSWVKEYQGDYKYVRPLCVFVVVIALFYINTYLLVPKLFFKGQYLLYLVCMIILVKAGLIVVSFLLDFCFGPNDLTHDGMRLSRPGSEYDGMLMLVPIIFMTTTIKLFQRWTRDNERIASLNQLNLTMELNGLRNQINPHFLFNMLNNIKALVRVDQEKAATVLVKFSEFLRYQLYENSEGRVLLRNELNFISNFLNLEKLRRDNLLVEIQYLSPSVNINEVSLPPNLFTTFIENAVKHGVTIKPDNSFINVRIEVTGNKLVFTCENSTDPEYIPSSSGGLGLPNIQRRLKLLYENAHQLDIQTTADRFTVNLTIPL